MKYVIIDQPLKPFEPQGFKGLTVPLNIAESKIRAMIPRVRIEVTDLSDTFNLGADLKIIEGKGKRWIERPVF